jgi:2-polyprenyl-3-methyl-5-hydroxy-6-metoxy-1,4-benzoquinol methylase
LTFSQSNNRWFSRHGAFAYLKLDQDNILRVNRVIHYLHRYLDTLPPKPKLLDLGCGDGQLSQRFQHLGYQVYGLDISASNVKLAQTRGIKAKTTDISKKFPFPNRTFDVVFAGEIIEHLFDTLGFLKEIHRVLKPNGLLIITTPNLAHLPDRFYFLLGHSPAQVSPLHHFLKFHIRPFTYGTLKHALKTSGFTATKFESTMVVFSRDPTNPELVTSKSELLARLFPSLGSFLIVYSRKL